MKGILSIMGCILLLATCAFGSGLSIDSPLEYQVFQRSSKLEGVMKISGSAGAGCSAVKCRICGKSLKGKLDGEWFAVPADKSSGKFEKSVKVPAGGWYTVDFKAVYGGKAVYSSLAHVGVGEVFVIAGQSNSTNCGDTKMTVESGMMSSFDGKKWKLGNDPQEGTHDFTGMGSFLPAFGDAMYARFGVPIGIASTGSGGSYVADWQPDAVPFGLSPREKTFPRLYDWMMVRVKYFGKNGFRAVMWHQGESDFETPVQDIYSGMVNLINASNKDAGWKFPWIVAKASYLEPYCKPFDNPRTAHQMLWDTGVAIQGPDTDILGACYRVNGGTGDHFTAVGLKLHGEMWAKCVGDYLDKVLK